MSTHLARIAEDHKYTTKKVNFFGIQMKSHAILTCLCFDSRKEHYKDSCYMNSALREATNFHCYLKLIYHDFRTYNFPWAFSEMLLPLC